MARSKNKPSQIPQPRSGELPEEFALRRTIAKLQLKHARAALATYGAADRGRRNKDWKASGASADLAIVPDAPLMLARARQMVRDNWVGRSVVRSYVRNIAGRGMGVTPHAKDIDGKPLVELNRVAKREYDKWAHSKLSDVERKQTFGQKQRLAVRERATVGEHLIVWSYQIPLDSREKIDKSRPVGLKLQSFEPEQFDLRIFSYEGREVRGGVEVDEGGGPLAYHLYTRNPNDLLYRHAFLSKRIEANRVFHYFDEERVLQSRGVTPMAPALQDMRDLASNKDATMMRTKLEACIAGAIKSPAPSSSTGPGQTILPRQTGDSGTTGSGVSTFDFMPGMVGRLLPGEEIEFLTPQSPGNQYAPFTELTVRGIGAATGMSFGQVMRQSDGNYSSARQDMLEDRKEWEPEQDLLRDDIVRPTYETFFNFAAMEGRFDGVEGWDLEAFLADKHRFLEADYSPPPKTEIDPEKEANAEAARLKNRLITREEIIAQRGGRYFQTIQKLAVEKAETEDLGLSLPENEDERKGSRELVKALLSNRLGTLDNATFNAADIEELLEDAGMRVRDGAFVPLLPVVSAPGEMITGDPVENAEGDVIGGGVKAPVAPPPGATPSAGLPSNGKANGNGAAKAAMGNGHNKNKKRSDATALVHQLLGIVAQFGPIGPAKLAARFGHEYSSVVGVLRGLEAAGYLLDTERGFRVSDKGRRLASKQPIAPPAAGESRRSPLAVINEGRAAAPNYREATDPDTAACATCSFNTAGHCTRFDFDIDPSNVCDAWAALPVSPATPDGGAKSFGPFKRDGEPELDRQFFPDASNQRPI